MECFQLHQKSGTHAYLIPTMRLSVRTLLIPNKSLSKTAAVAFVLGSFPHIRTAYVSDPPENKENNNLELYPTMTMSSKLFVSSCSEFLKFYNQGQNSDRGSLGPSTGTTILHRNGLQLHVHPCIYASY